MATNELHEIAPETDPEAPGLTEADEQDEPTTPSELVVLLKEQDGVETIEEQEEISIADLVQLHPNALAQLDAAFKRHRWLVATSGAGALLDRHSRLTNRGRKRQGLDGNTFYALMLTAVFATQQATIEQMYAVSRTLPLRTRLENGFVALRDGRMTELLSKKDLQNMNGDIGLNLDPVRINLTKAEQAKPAHEQARIIARRRQERLDALAEIRTAMLRATHLIAVAHGTYAIDDTAIWAWRKADRRAPTKTDMPSRPLSDEDSRPQAPATLDATEPARSECLDGRSRTDGAWGGKTGKDGKTTLFFGYKAHVIVNTNDPKRKNALPILIQALELTPASQDIVDVSLRLIDEIRARAPFTRLIGDRHYSYKKFDRWALELWRRRLHQVLDLRVDKPGAVDRWGALIIDGWPHCPAVPQSLRDVTLPDNPNDQKFQHVIQTRKDFALRMVKGPLASEPALAAGQDDPNVGTTRWQCPALVGSIGCLLREGTVEVAEQLGLQTVQTPPHADKAPRCCTQSTISIKADDSMKYLQENYWGSGKWNHLYALRTAVEGVFGNLKNHGTEGVRRGFYQTDGIHMITLAVTAAAACYNIRTLEKFSREQGQRIDHPLMNHPLDDRLLENVLLEGDEVIDYVERHTPAAA